MVWGGVFFLLQLIIGIILIAKTIHSQKNDTLKVLYGKAIILPENRQFKINGHYLKIFGGMILLLSFLNRHFFHIMGGKFDESSLFTAIFGLVYGWSTLLFLLLIVVIIIIDDMQLVKTFYFVKYAEKYRQFFNLSDKDWYGKRKAKRIEKRKNK